MKRQEIKVGQDYATTRGHKIRVLEGAKMCEPRTRFTRREEREGFWRKPAPAPSWEQRAAVWTP